MVFARGLAFAISGGRTIFNLDKTALLMGRGMVASVPFVAILWVSAIVVCSVVLRKGSLSHA
jgi:predicted ABC-type sugar transport system permease subunit